MLLSIITRVRLKPQGVQASPEMPKYPAAHTPGAFSVLLPVGWKLGASVLVGVDDGTALGDVTGASDGPTIGYLVGTTVCTALDRTVEVLVGVQEGTDVAAVELGAKLGRAVRAKLAATVG